MDERLPRLAQAKGFSVLDARNGFWQVQLDDESSNLTKIAISFGHYQWKRLPLSISHAPNIFEEELDCAIPGLVGTFAVFDDILVVHECETPKEADGKHDARLSTLLEREGGRSLK